MKEEWFSVSKDPALVVALPDFEGVDFRVTFVYKGEMVFIYRQMKFQKSSSNSILANIVANTIIGVINKHLEVVSSCKTPFRLRKCVRCVLPVVRNGGGNG